MDTITSQSPPTIAESMQQSTVHPSYDPASDKSLQQRLAHGQNQMNGQKQRNGQLSDAQMQTALEQEEVVYAGDEQKKNDDTILPTLNPRLYFQPNAKYRFGSIAEKDAKEANYHNPNFAQNFPVHRKGSDFIARGYITIEDFQRNGKQDNGKPFTPKKTFVMQLLDDVTLVPETIAIWEFSAPERKSDNSKSLGDGEISAPASTTRKAAKQTNMQRFHHSTPTDTAVKNDAMNTAQAISTVSSFQQQALDVVKGENESLRTALQTAQTELAKIKIEHSAYQSNAAALEAENSRLKATLSEKEEELRKRYEEKEKELKVEYGAKLATERELIKMQHEVTLQAKIEAAVEEAREQWEEEREEEEQSLRDELALEAQRDLAEKYRDLAQQYELLKRERERDEEKRGLMDKGMEFIGKLTEKPEVSAGLTHIIGNVIGSIAAKTGYVPPQQAQQAGLPSNASQGVSQAPPASPQNAAGEEDEWVDSPSA